jgi:hypothetical protein
MRSGVGEQHGGQSRGGQHSRRRRPTSRAARDLVRRRCEFFIASATLDPRTARDAPQNFTEEISRTDALYFTVTVTVTVFAIVGFGGIAPRTDLARIITMIQMITGLVAVGLVVRVVLGAARWPVRGGRLRKPMRRGRGLPPAGQQSCPRASTTGRRRRIREPVTTTGRADSTQRKATA